MLAKINDKSKKSCNEWEKLAYSFTNELVSFIQTDYGYPEFELRNIDLRWDAKDEWSHGGLRNGGAFIDINLYPYVNTLIAKNCIAWWESKNFQTNDSDIGVLYDVKCDNAVKDAISHEVSHALHYTLDPSLPDEYHGPEFIKHYKMFRNTFINPYLPPQKECKDLVTLITTNCNNTSISERLSVLWNNYG